MSAAETMDALGKAEPSATERKGAPSACAIRMPPEKSRRQSTLLKLEK